MSTLSTEQACAAPMAPASCRHPDGRYRNPVPRPRLGMWKHLKLYWTVFFNKPGFTVPDRPIPVQTLTRADVLAAPDNSVFRLGHSTLLLKLHDKYWLTDPVFAKRASPVQWLGPSRFHAPPISIEALPPIEAVILSHNHYDHLDRQAVLALAHKTRHFIAPLGVGDLLVAWGIRAERVHQLGWWDAIDIDGIRFVATPAQHFSGRGVRDSDKTLWASWVILERRLRLFFSGDSGYFDGFKRIGDRYGPFDVTFMETGAYDPKWAYVHMLPEQTVQAHADLRGKWLFPIHNGTFDLALHRWSDPFERISRLAMRHQIPLSTPVMGQCVDLTDPQLGSPWWQD